MNCFETKWNNLKNLINLLLASSPGKSSHHPPPPLRHKLTQKHVHTCPQTDRCSCRQISPSFPTTNLHSRADVLLALGPCQPAGLVDSQVGKSDGERGRRGRKGWIRFWFAIRRLDFERRQRRGLWLCGMPFFVVCFRMTARAFSRSAQFYVEIGKVQREGG